MTEKCREDMTVEELYNARVKAFARLRELEAQDETGWSDFDVMVKGKKSNIGLVKNHIIYYTEELEMRSKAGLLKWC